MALKSGRLIWEALWMYRENSDPSLAGRYESLARFCALSVAGLGAAVLAGWGWDVAALKSVLPGLVTMKPNTAFGFLLAGISLALACTPDLSLRWRSAHLVLAVMVGLLGFLTLGEYLLATDFGIDQVLFAVPSEPNSGTAPGRMAMATAVGFVFCGLALLLLDSKRGWVVSQAAALAGNLIGLLAAVGYVYGVESLYGVFAYSSVALHTAVGFVSVTVGTFFARPRRGLLAVVISPSAGGIMARRLLPLALIAPFLIGWLRVQGEHMGLYTSEFGVALVAVTYMLLFSTFVWRTAEVLRVSEQRRIEADRQRQLQHTQLTALVESAMDAIIMVNGTQRILMFNPAAEQMFGHKAACVLGGSLEMLMPPHFQTRHKDHILAFGATGATNRRMGSFGAVTGLRASGEEFPIEASISQLEVAGEKYYKAILRDITDRVRAEAEIRSLNAALEHRVEQRTAELEKANAALVKSNQELQQFAFVAAHDLQTPLRSISGFAQILRQDFEGKHDERTDMLVGQVVSNTRRMQTLIQDLLAYARLGAKLRPFEQVDCQQLCDDVAADLAATLAEAGATVTRGDLPVVMGDRNQLGQLLQNLIENGVKFHGSEPPQVHVSVEPTGDEWVFSVRDNGIGIEPKHQEKIFQIFQRLHPAHAYPGTGIGLAICRRVVEHHGGRIWVESQPGAGSVFKFTLKKVEVIV